MMIVKIKSRKAKKQLSKAYLKRQAEVNEKWSKHPSKGDELVEDLEYLVGIRKELAK